LTFRRRRESLKDIKKNRPCTLVLLLNTQLLILLRYYTLTGVSWVQDGGFAAARQDHVEVALGNFPAGSAVPVDPHRAQVHLM